jgi:hypothetical protein
MKRFLIVFTVLGALAFVTSRASATVLDTPLSVGIPDDLSVLNVSQSTLLAGDCYYGGGRAYQSYRRAPYPRAYYPRTSYYGGPPYPRGYGAVRGYGGVYGGRGSYYGPGRRGYGGYGRGGSGLGLYIAF